MKISCKITSFTIIVETLYHKLVDLQIGALKYRYLRTYSFWIV